MAGSDHNVRVKRVYDSPASPDGFRVLVDRLWPRGLSKQNARIDLWLRDIAPSNELRKWFHANPEEWTEFKKRYIQELRKESASAAVERLYEAIEHSNTVSLLFASKMLERNNATVLRDFVKGMKKPPKGTGPIRSARTQSRRRAVR